MLDCQTTKRKNYEELIRPDLQARLGINVRNRKNYFQVGKKNASDKALIYLQGLFKLERGTRNIERMVEQIKESEYESLQHFISNSPWDSKGLMQSIATSIYNILKPQGKICCTVDEKAILKKGTESVAVTRQYAGCVGKVENCQVGVYLSLSSSKYAGISNLRLYLPEEWTSDKKRCIKAGIPETKIKFKTKQELAIEMVKEHLENKIQPDYFNGDGLYGNGYEFSKELTRLGQKYVLDVHKDQRIFLKCPQISIPEDYEGKRGRKNTKLRASEPSMCVLEYKNGLKKKDFAKIKIRKTTKGWLYEEVHVARVWVWDEHNGDKKAIEQTLVITKSIAKNPKTKFSLSNISIKEQLPKDFALMQAQRFWIEKCFRECSHDLGMGDYQVRTYKGWYNHMVLTCFALEFILQEKLLHNKNIPLTSVNDVRLILGATIISKFNDQKGIYDAIIKKHYQRIIDIGKYYEDGPLEYLL